MKINFRLVLISGLILLSSFFASIMADMKVRESLRSSFIGLANLVEGEIAYQLQMTSNSMEQVRAMILVSSKLNSEKFNKYLKYSRQSQKHFPLSHVGYIELLPGDKEKRSVERLWPGLKNDFAHYESSEKDFEIAPGHKFMMAETIREAIRTGSVQSTIINLKPIGQEALEHGFIFYLPVFSEEGPRRLRGLLYSVNRSKTFFDSIIPRDYSKFSIEHEVYLMRNTGADLIYDHDHVPFDHLHFTPIFSYSTIIKTGGREWRFLAYSLKKFNSSIWFWLPFTIAVLGMGVTFFVFWNFRKIEEAKQNEHLRVKQLESLNEVGHTIASELELSGLVKAVIESAVKLTEAEFGVFFYRNREEECSLFSHALAGPSEKDHWVKPFMESELFNTAISERKIITFDGPDLLPGWPDGSYLVVPFWSRQGMVDGAICLWHGQRGKFTQIELSIIQGLSAETSIGIDNAVLFKQAKEAVSLRDEFLSIASHELKTPLTSMKLQVQMSLRSSLAFRGPLEGLVEKQAEALKRTLLHINRLSGLVEELLDVTRIQHGKLILRPSNFDLVLLIHETVGGFKEELARQYCTFILKAPAMVMVSLDYLRTQQVFTNLLSNVVKYAPGSHVLIDITQTEDSVEIIFSDDGPGIPKGKLDSIFNRFERANAPLNASGLGLGLYIVREIMLAHGGKVEVDGDIGQGTKFVLKFPLAEVNEKHDALATVS